FDIMASEYDAWYDSDQGKPLYESELKCLKPLVPEGGLPLLEIGVGTGRFAMHFPGAYGLDPARGALNLAQKRGIKCVNGAGERLPFRDNVFKTVMIIATLCFVKEPLSVIHEAARVLAPGGISVIGFIPRGSPWGMLYEKKKREGSPFYRGARFYTLSDIEGFARSAGLCVTSIMSTLLQEPVGPARVEEPSARYVEGAGFVFLRLEKKKDC
ncbi:MAG: class I SAM-dependent methyltransferase, partial [Deltaproteobacteria bacterium]|nr:class I SAM-dependent methyltransferase [Deltaproteobacteria bacterium]